MKNQQFFERHAYEIKKYNLEKPRNFLKKRSKATQRSNKEKVGF